MNHLRGDGWPSGAACCYDDLVLCVGCRAQCRSYSGADGPWSVCLSGGRWWIMAGLVAKRTLGNLSRLPWWADQGETTGKQSGSTCVFSCCSLLSPFRPASCSSGCLAPGTPEEWELVNSWSTSSDFPHPKNKCTRNYGNRFIRTAVENIVIQCLQTNLLDKLGAFRVYLKFEGLWNVPVTIGEIAKQDSSGRVKGSHCGWEELRGKKGIQLWR